MPPQRPFADVLAETLSAMRQAASDTNFQPSVLRTIFETCARLGRAGLEAAPPNPSQEQLSHALGEGSYAIGHATALANHIPTDVRNRSQGMMESFRRAYGVGAPRGQTEYVVHLDDANLFEQTYRGQVTEEADHFERQIYQGLGLPPPVLSRGVYRIARPLDPHEELRANLDRTYERMERDGTFSAMVESIQAQVDREIIDTIHAAAAAEVAAAAVGMVRDPPFADPRRLQTPLLRPGEVYMASEPTGPVGFSVREEIGIGVFNPRAAQIAAGTRVPFTAFEVQSNPTVNIDDIRQRRFSIRAQPPIPPQGEMTLEQMREVALIVRRTVWERLLFDPDEYPCAVPEAMALQERIAREIDAEVLDAYFDQDEQSDKRRSAWDRLGGDL